MTNVTALAVLVFSAMGRIMSWAKDAVDWAQDSRQGGYRE
jgi:hypothetical protein